MHTGKSTTRTAVAVLGLVALLTGCAATSTPDAAAPAAPDEAGAPDGAGTVNANTASVAELEAAFEAAGIPNAAQWAHEVEEYRPYPADDPTFAKLRSELAKYNPSDEVVDQIVATLTL